jgi:hypothetical protein
MRVSQDLAVNGLEVFPASTVHGRVRPETARPHRSVAVRKSREYVLKTTAGVRNMSAVNARDPAARTLMPDRRLGHTAVRACPASLVPTHG